MWNFAPFVCKTWSWSARPERRQQDPRRAAREVQAFDVRTGKPRWAFNPIPRPGEPGNETWENDSWPTPARQRLVDDERRRELGYGYLADRSPASDMYGGHRLGDNLFGNSSSA